MKKWIYLSVIFLGFAACSTPKEKLEKKLKKSITEYMEVNKGKEDKIDSITIQDIDTLTPASYLFLYQQSLQNQAEMIGKKFAEAMEEGDVSASESLDKRNVKTLNKLDSCTKAIESPTVDKGTLWGYFVITKVYVKHPDNTTEAMDIGFPITKEFKVYEMDL
jgi:hypothetical protein